MKEMTIHFYDFNVVYFDFYKKSFNSWGQN